MYTCVCEREHVPRFMHIGVCICVYLCMCPRECPSHRCLPVSVCVGVFQREREHKHRFMHIGVCMCLCVEVLAHGHVCVVTRERVVRCVHMGLSLCAGVCVCVSKRAWLSCIHMGMCVCVHACTGGFTWEWGGLALEE